MKFDSSGLIRGLQQPRVSNVLSVLPFSLLSDRALRDVACLKINILEYPGSDRTRVRFGEGVIKRVLSVRFQKCR